MTADGSSNVDLGYRPRPWQDRVHRKLKRFSVLVVHRRGGKTMLAILALIDAALRTRKADARYAYLGPFLKQAKAVAWTYLKRYALKVPGAVANESELWVQFPNGAQVRIYGADHPDGLRGIYLDGVVLDEVADMKPEIWGEVIRPTLADRIGWALFIGTAKGINLLSDLFFFAQKDPEWHAEQLTCFDTDALPPSEIEAMKRGMTDEQFRREMLCDFTVAAESQLIGLDLVMAAMGRHIAEDAYKLSPKVLGVDVARQGDDRSVIVRRQGLASFKPMVMRGMESMQVAGACAAEIAAWDPDAVFVDGSGGYGAGVIDRLRELGHTVIEVQFGGSPIDARYVNKRSEIWFGAMEWLKAGGALAPDEPDYRVDLCGPTYWHNSSGQFVLEPKEKVKERGMPSPDLGDALALTFAFPVAGRQSPTRRSGHARVVFDYDPFAQ